MTPLDKPIVWALQHIETCELAKRGESVILCPTEEDVEVHVRPLVFEPSNWRAVGFHIKPHEVFEHTGIVGWRWL